jgi:hypothetical protein
MSGMAYNLSPGELRAEKVKYAEMIHQLLRANPRLKLVVHHNLEKGKTLTDQDLAHLNRMAEEPGGAALVSAAFLMKLEQQFYQALKLIHAGLNKALSSRLEDISRTHQRFSEFVSGQDPEELPLGTAILLARRAHHLKTLQSYWERQQGPSSPP